MTAFWKQSVCGGLAAGVTVLSAAPPASASRLFGTSRDIPGILELDPLTGDIINTLASPPQSTRDGLAFDGTSLWFIGPTEDTLFRLDPNTGATLETFALPGVPPEDEDFDSGLRGGLAYLNGELYITNSDFQIQDIEVFNIAAGEVVRILDIDGTNPELLFGFANNGLAAITGPDQLIVSTGLSQEVFFIDPMTGEVTGRFGHNQFGVNGIAVLGDLLFLGSSDIGIDNDGVENINVYSREGEQQYFINIDGSTGINSLAGDHTAIPEPGSAALLAVGAVALLRRRRR